MSQPRRRRRRRRRASGDSSAEQSQRSADAQATPQKGGRPGRGRRRRGRRGSGGHKPPSPQTIEDVVREINGDPPDSLTAPADGRTLEQVIGDLQSEWGVPQYPQEYRITLKVADEPRPAPPERETKNGPNGVTRERAPAAPRVGPAPTEGGSRREKAPRRRRRARRGRRRRGEGE
jgi:hypothetical protein